MKNSWRENENSTISLLEKRFKKLEQEYLSYKRIMDSFREEILIPISIFTDRKLSALELIVRFLKEERRLANKDISELLNRNPKTVWATYNIAIKKSRQKLDTSSGVIFPASIFRERKLSVLESIVHYLNQKFSPDEISVFLRRDVRTIKTIIWRIRQKNEQG